MDVLGAGSVVSVSDVHVLCRNSRSTIPHHNRKDGKTVRVKISEKAVEIFLVVTLYLTMAVASIGALILDLT